MIVKECYRASFCKNETIHQNYILINIINIHDLFFLKLYLTNSSIVALDIQFSYINLMYDISGIEIGKEERASGE